MTGFDGMLVVLSVACSWAGRRLVVFGSCPIHTVDLASLA